MQPLPSFVLCLPGGQLALIGLLCILLLLGLLLFRSFLFFCLLICSQSAEAPLLSTDPPCVLGVGWHSLGWLSHHDHHDESSHSCFHFPEPADPAKHSPTRNHPSSIGRTIGSHPMRMRSNPDPIPRMHPTTQRTSSSAPTLPHGTWSNNSIYTYMYVYLYKYIYIYIRYIIIFYTIRTTI